MVAWAALHVTVIGDGAHAGASTGGAAQAAQPAAGSAGPSARLLQPAPTAVGTPFGDVSTTVIGPDGGTLSSADGVVTLDVPAGAVGKDMPFGIQSITNHAEGRVGGAFRITPEGTAFTVPARLTFRYTDDAVLGSAPEALRIAYQDALGYWRAPRNVTVDARAKTVSVTTTHLSDWSQLLGVRITPSDAAVKVGGTIALRVVLCGAVEQPEPPEPGELNVEPLTTPCADLSVVPGGPYVDRWAANGVVAGSAAIGSVSPTIDLAHADYTAPAKAPKGNPVAVSVVYHDQSGRTTLLVANITVIDPAATCDEVRAADELDAGFTFTYGFSGADAQGHRFTVDQNASLTARLVRVPGTNLSSVVWRGPARAGVGLHDAFAMDGVTQSVTGIDALPGGADVVVTLRLKDCAYTVAAEALATSLTVMEAGAIRLPTKGNTLVGSARTGFRPARTGLSGQDNLSIGPQDRDSLGDYQPGGFGKDLLAGFKAGDLGSATVTWVVGVPPKP